MHSPWAPPDLPACCDGCDAPFTLQHALPCKKGALVIFRLHNEIRDELVNLVGKAFPPSAAREKTLIKPSRVKRSDEDTPTKDTSQEKWNRRLLPAKMTAMIF
jgi:hypothetical protein